VERRLAFLGVTFDTVETYGYKVHNARHNSPIVQAMQDPHNTPMHWSAGEAARPKRKARLAEQQLRQEQQREEEQTVQQLHQLMKKAHKAFYGAVRSANEHVKKRLDIATGNAEQQRKLEDWEGTEWEAEHQNEFEQITSEWKALGGEPDQDSCDESDC
jgi:endo-alpha-1,4-polygalactosaminidase (GH114 family)